MTQSPSEPLTATAAREPGKLAAAHAAAGPRAQRAAARGRCSRPTPPRPAGAQTEGSADACSPRHLSGAATPADPARAPARPPLVAPRQLLPAGDAAGLRRHHLSLHPCGRPVSLDHRFLGPLRAAQRRGRRHPRRDHPARLGHRFRHQRALRLHPQPATSSRSSMPSSTCGTIYNRHPEDVCFSLGKDATIEDLLAYWRRMVSVDLSNAGIIQVRVNAFTPEDAHAIAEEILAEFGKVINQLSVQAHEDAVKFSREELTMAEDNLRKCARRTRGFPPRRTISSIPRATCAGQVGHPERAAVRARQGDGRARHDPHLRRRQGPAGDPGRPAHRRDLQADRGRARRDGERRGSRARCPTWSATTRTLRVDLEFASTAYTHALAGLAAARGRRGGSRATLRRTSSRRWPRSSLYPAARRAGGDGHAVPGARVEHRSCSSTTTSATTTAERAAAHDRVPQRLQALPHASPAARSSSTI